MEELDNTWILKESTDCSESDRDSAPATLGLTNMAGRYILSQEILGLTNMAGK